MFPWCRLQKLLTRHKVYKLLDLMPPAWAPVFQVLNFKACKSCKLLTVRDAQKPPTLMFLYSSCCLWLKAFTPDQFKTRSSLCALRLAFHPSSQPFLHRHSCRVSRDESARVQNSWNIWMLCFVLLMWNMTEPFLQPLVRSTGLDDCVFEVFRKWANTQNN